MTSRISQNPTFIDASGKMGVRGLDGRHGKSADYIGNSGENGTSGTDGHPGGNGKDVALIIVAKKTHAEVHGWSDVKQFDPKVPDFLIRVSAKGGNGGRGGNGGAGGAGQQGFAGKNGNKCAGGPGGEGGHGGHAGSGGGGSDGGHGGNVSISVQEAQTDLLALTQIDIRGGTNGKGGQGGIGGQAGLGGPGGKGCTWSTTTIRTDSQGYTHYDTQYYSRPPGPPGPPGFDGNSGGNGASGRSGRDGTIKYIICKSDGTQKIYSKPFHIILGQHICQIDAGVCEPGRKYTIQNLSLLNTSEMPLPELEVSPHLEIQSNSLITSSNRLLIEKSIPSEEQISIPGTLEFEVNPFDPSTLPPNQTLYQRIFLVLKCVFPRVNKSLSFPLDDVLAVQYPLSMTQPSVPHVAQRGILYPIAVKLIPLTKESLGEDSLSKRVVKVAFSMDNPHNAETYFQGENTSEVLLTNNVERSFPIIEKGNPYYFAGTIRFSSDIPPAKSLNFRVSLQLANTIDPSQIETIQRAHFTTTISETFQLNPNADLVLCINQETPQEIVNEWKVFFSKMGIEIMIWDLFLYNGFRFDQVIENTELRDHLKGKVVILFNHYFEGKNGRTTLPSACFSSRDVFTALNESNIGLHVIGENVNLESFCLPDFKTEAISKYTSEQEFINAMKKDAVKFPAKITFIERSFSKPDKSHMIHRVKQLTEDLERAQPKRRFFTVYNSKTEVCVKGIRTVWSLGDATIFAGRLADTTRLTHHAVESTSSMHSHSPLHYFQAIKHLPFERKLDVFRTNVDNRVTLKFLSRAILSDLIEEVSLFWKHDTASAFEEQKWWDLLPRLNKFVEVFEVNEDECFKPTLEFILANYKAIIYSAQPPTILRTIKEQFVQSRFYFLKLAAEVGLEKLLATYQIDEKEHEAAVNSIIKMGKKIGFEELAERSTNPHNNDHLIKDNQTSLQTLRTTINEFPFEHEQIGVPVELPNDSTASRKELIENQKTKLK